MQNGSHWWLSVFFGALTICCVQYSSAISPQTLLTPSEKSFKAVPSFTPRPDARLMRGFGKEIDRFLSTSWN